MGLLRRLPSRRALFEEEALIHLDALYAGALRLTRNPDAANDLVQDTLLKAYKAFDKYEPGTNCKAWLFRIMYNDFISGTRKRARERRVVSDAPLDPERSSAPDETAPRDRMTSEAVKRALDELPVDYRAVVVLADLHDLSYREIAEVIDRPIGTVMSRLHRGRRLLQEKLLGQAIEYGIVKGEGEEANDAPPADLMAFRRRRSEGE